MSTIQAGSLNVTQAVKTYQTTAQTIEKQTDDEKTQIASPASLPEPGTEKTNLVETSSQGDLLEISAQGSDAAAGISAVADSSDSAVASAGLSEEEDDSSDLSSYSEIQLQNMVNSGEITQAEYDQELARREAEEAGQNAAKGADSYTQQGIENFNLTN